MKKITVLLSLVAGVVLLAACNSKKSEAASEDTTGEKEEVNGIARSVVDNVLSRVRDADTDVEDVVPILDEPYSSEGEGMWIFSEEDGELEGEYTTFYNEAKCTTCRLSKRGPAAYDAYPDERDVAMCVLRVKDGGEIIEMTEGSKTIVFKVYDRIMREGKEVLDEIRAEGEPHLLKFQEMPKQ